MDLGHGEIIGRLLAALLLGAGIGAERQWRQRDAGLRTNTLVSVGAALYVLLSVLTPGEVSPTRIAAQVVSGIGFLGAGVILRDGASVRGLNTAATLWCSASIGCLCGAGLALEAGLGAALIVGSNVVLRPLGRAINRAPARSTDTVVAYRLRVTCAADSEARVRAVLLQAVFGFHLHALHSEQVADDRGCVSVLAELTSHEGRQDARIEHAAGQLSLEPSVSGVHWETPAPAVPDVPVAPPVDPASPGGPASPVGPAPPADGLVGRRWFGGRVGSPAARTRV